MGACFFANGKVPSEGEMIESVGENRCCGCEACVQACPKHCISMVENAEGFLYPQVDAQNCVKCGRCLKVCPVLNELERPKPVAGYAYRTTDEALLKQTSSGGFFTAVAERVLEESGVVFGAAFNDQNEVVHCFIENKDDLDKLRRSKYVQSRIGTSFADCKRFLEDGRKVLFCGTPCQVKALNLFLGNKPTNLITIDFVCHGVPSPGVFKRYLEELARDKGGDVAQLHEINFRAKGFGYSYSFAFAFAFAHYMENPNDNIFLRGFLRDVYLRRSCYKCSAKGFSSGSDYTMCDFWTVRKHMPKFPLGEVPGVSQVFVHRDKMRMFVANSAGAIVMPFDVCDSRIVPRWAKVSVPLTWRRKRFFELFERGHMKMAEIVGEVSGQTLLERMIGSSRKYVGRLLRSIGAR